MGGNACNKIVNNVIMSYEVKIIDRLKKWQMSTLSGDFLKQ